MRILDICGNPGWENHGEKSCLELLSKSRFIEIINKLQPWIRKQTIGDTNPHF
jgi:hypothetical protein